MFLKNLVIIQILAHAVFFVDTALAAPWTFNVDGVISDSSNQPLEAASVTFRIDIKDSSETCLLYREDFTVSMTGSSGYFSLVVGKQTNAIAGGLTLDKVFSNAAAAIPGQSCSYTPASSSAARKIIVSFNDGSTSQIFTSQEIQSVPYAVAAEEATRFTGSLSGDVTGSQTGTVVGKIQGAPVDLTGIADGKILKYQSGSFVVADDQTGSGGITSINGLTAASQSFSAIDLGNSVLSPTWVSSSSAHTLKIPMASATGTTAGLISYSDYVSFGTKITSLTGDVTASGVGAINATIGVGKVTSSHILDGTIVGGDMNFTGVNDSTAGIVLKDSAGKFMNFTCPTATNVLTWTGTSWDCLPPAATGITTINGLNASSQTLAAAASAGGTTLGFTSSSSTHTLNIPMASTASVTAGLVSNTDYVAFNNKLPLSGGNMSGAINMGGNNITNTGNIAMAINKYLTLSSNSTDGTTAGQVWYDSGVIKYFDGTTTRSLGVSGAGIMTFNGLSGSTQTVVVNTTGTDPGFNSSGSTHTLNIPMASTPSANAGLISNADYLLIKNSQSNSLAAGKIWVGNAANGAQAVTLNGDISAVSNTGGVTVNKTTLGAANTILSLDGSSVGTMAGVSLVNGGAVTLSASGTSATYGLKFPMAAPTGGQVLQSDASGNLTWIATPSFSMPGLANGKIWIGNSANGFEPQVMGGDATISNTGVVTLKNTGAIGTYYKVVTDAQGRVTFGSNLAANDITAALTYTPVNKAGDTMTGDLSTQAITMANNKYFTVSNYAGATGAAAGQLWYDAGVLKYYNGSAAVTLATSGGSIVSLNGLTGTTQTFATPGTAGTAPGWTFAGSTHTLNIPMANTGSVTAGLISNTDYNAFNSKQSNSLGSTQVWVGNAANGAQARTLAGDITIDNAGNTTLKNTGTVGTYYKVTTDAQGRVVSGTSSISTTDLPSLADGKIWIGNSGNTATANTMGGDATISNTGNLALKNVGTAGTYFKVTTDAQGRVTSGSNLAAGDITTALTYTPVNKAGDTMSGDLMLAAGKYLGLGSGSTAGTVAGQVWYDSGTIKYFDGTTTKALGVAGAGITTLNGLSTTTQTFGTGTTGSDFNISSSGSGHIFNIPSASSSNRGALTSADWTTFNSKQSNSLAVGQMWVGNASGGAQAFALGGDISSVSNVGSVLINKTTSAAANTILSLDSSGVGNMKGLGLVNGGNTVTLSPAAGTAAYSLTLPGTAPANNQILQSNSSGVMTWVSNVPAVNNATTLTNNKIWIGNASNIAVEQTMGGDATIANNGTLTLKNTGTAGTYPKVTTDAQGRVTSGSALASSDITSALTYTPLNKAGDTMTGDLVMANNKYFTVSNYAGAAGSAAGQLWYDAGVLKYYNGSSAVTLGVAGAGITSLNGLTGPTQTFATPGTAGTAPGWTFAGSTHTLNIPMANTAAVTGGLISNTDYNTFNSKQSNALAAGQIWVGNVSGGAQAFSLVGDISSVSNVGSVVVNKTTTAQNNMILSLDGSGVGNVKGIGFVNTGTVTLSAQTASSTYSLKFPAASPTGNQILQTNAIGDLSWVSNVPSVNNAATLTSGKIWIGNASGVAVEQTMSGDATITNTGSLALKNVGTAGTYTRVTTDAQGRVTAGAALLSSDVTGALGFSPASGATAFVNGGNSFGANADIGLNDNFLLNFRTNSTTRMTIDSGGLIGIGLTTPSAMLHINDTNRSLASAQANAIIQSSTSGIDNGGNIALAGNDGSTSGRMFASIAGRKENATSGDYSSYFQIATRANGGALTEKMRIDSTGRVGIGTTSPSVSLDLGSKTDAILLPKGASQPGSPIAGMLRYNTTPNALEFYNGTVWQNIGAALGYIPVNKAGDTMSGDLMLAAGKYLGLGSGSTAGTVAGQVWYDSGTIKYYDGTTTKALGIAGAGITSLNGLTVNTQTFGTGTTGTDFNISSSGSGHIFNIPSASSSNRGALTQTDWTTFNNKQSNGLNAGQIWVGNATNGAQARTLAGDITTITNAGVVTVTKTTTAANNTIVSTDGTGGVTATAFGVKGPSATVTLIGPQAAINYSLTYPDFAPANGQVLMSNSSGILSWVSPAGFIGYTPLNKAGDAMSGDLNMNGNNIMSAGTYYSTAAMNLVAANGANASSGNGAPVNITAQSATGASSTGGNIYLNPGSGNTTRGVVSIGNPSPTQSYLLNVGNSSSPDVAYFASNNASAANVYALNFNASGAAGFFMNQSTSAYAKLGVGTNAALFGGGNVGIGTNSPTAKLQISDTFATDPGSGTVATSLDVKHSPYSASSSSTAFAGIQSVVTPAGGSFTVSSASGANLLINNNSSTNITNAYGAQISVINPSSANITNAYGALVSVNNLSSGTITNGYGLYIGNASGTNKWSLYASDATAPSYFAGRVGIGVSNPNFPLDISGSTSSIIKVANTNPNSVAGNFQNSGSGVSAGLAMGNNSINLNGHMASTDVNVATSGSCTPSGTATIAGTDTRGTVTFPSSATACTLTFNRQYTNSPTCVISAGSIPGATTFYVTATQTTMTINLSAASPSLKINYICMD